MSAVLFEPHADDAVLFAAFTVIDHRPRVVTCFPSSGDYGFDAVRTAETTEAMRLLGGGPLEQWDGRDLVARMHNLDALVSPSVVFAPHPQASHPDHVAVAIAAREVFGVRLRTYHTYDAGGKVASDYEVAFPPHGVYMKLRALCCYRSQLTHPRACRFFLDGLREYAGEP